MTVYSLTYSFLNLEPVHCSMYLFLIVASWHAYRFLRRQVKWCGIPISWRIFHSLLWSTQSSVQHIWQNSCQCRKSGFNPWVRKISWSRKCQPDPLLLPGKFYGQRSLVGCSPWGREGWNTTEQLHFHFSLSGIGERDGNPLQCSRWRIPGTGEAGGLPFTESHRVGHDWNDLAAAISISYMCPHVWFISSNCFFFHRSIVCMLVSHYNISFIKLDNW